MLWLQTDKHTKDSGLRLMMILVATIMATLPHLSALSTMMLWTPLTEHIFCVFSHLSDFFACACNLSMSQLCAHCLIAEWSNPFRNVFVSVRIGLKSVASHRLIFLQHDDTLSR